MVTTLQQFAMGRCLAASFLLALILTFAMLFSVSVLLTFTTIGSARNSIQNKVSIPNLTARPEPVHVVEDVQKTVQLVENVKTSVQVVEDVQMRPKEAEKIEFMLVTGERSVSCGSSKGSHVMMMTYKNKIDYCNIHGCKVWYALEVWEPGFTGTWVRCPLLLKLMKANPKIQWFMWMDSDAIFTDLNFSIPIKTYEEWGKKLVVHGFWDKVYAPNPDWISLNAGILLIKNCEWSHNFLQNWMRYGDPSNLAYSKMQLNSFLMRPKEWDPDDQSALIHLLNVNKTDSQANVHLEVSYDLHGYWKFIVDKYEDITNKKKTVPFITHFCGCNFCGSKKISSECYKGFRRAFNFADNQLLSRVSLSHLALNSPDPLLIATGKRSAASA